MKIFKKSLTLILALLMMLSCLSAVAFAANEAITVNLRIEGISKCLYYGEVETEKGASVLDVVKKADSLDNELTVTVVNGAYGSYISAVNDEAEKTFKGWDGWLFRVNDVEPQTGVSACTVSDGDSIVLYYGDPYGVGMQYPKADLSKISEGKISFTSIDTVYDENWNPQQKEVAVKDYKITWGYGKGKTVVIVPDENGVCTISKEYLDGGEHSLQIEKTAANGCPLVLRFAPDYTVSDGKSPANPFLSFFTKIINIIKTWIETILNLVKSLTQPK